MLKKRVLPVLLSLALAAAAALPVVYAVEASGEAEAEQPVPQTVNFTNAGPFLPVTLTEDQEEQDALKLDKKLTDNDDGSYKITMEAYTTGTVTTTTRTKPVDIILVLDQSGSMAYNWAGDQTRDWTTSRQYSLIQSVKSFIDSVNEKYDVSESDHRMALVKFGSAAEILQDWTFVDSNGKEQLLSEIERLPHSPSGATRIDLGMSKAESLMDENYNYTGENEDRQKVVILFTDGKPTEHSSYDGEVADNAVACAHRLKSTLNTTVYSIGIFKGADPSVLYGEYSTGKLESDLNPNKNTEWNSPKPSMDTETVAANRFMNYLSSNYADATSDGIKITTIGWARDSFKIDRIFERTTEDDYYLAASDTDALNDIFETISDNISSSTVDLGAESVVRDVVTPQFVMPEDAGDIRVRIMDAQYNNDGLTWTDSSYSTNNIKVTIDPQSRAVNVTGFDFEHNFVAENGRNENNPKEDGDFHGRKLVISFDVTVAPGFFGGNDVLTNGSGSGVYENAREQEAFKEFNFPKVNIPINYQVPNTSEQIFSGETPNLSGTSINYADGFKPDGVNNKYVDITYELKNPMGKTVGTFKISAGKTEGSWTQEPNVDLLYENTTYTIECTVSPISNGENADVGELATNKKVEAEHVVTVLNGTLTITKEMAEGTNADSGERFVFNIYKDGIQDPYMTVAVEAGQSVTIKNLSAGTYTVREDTSWSWRFKSELLSNGTVTIGASNPEATVICTNSRDNEQWLNKYDWAVNHQKDGGSVERAEGSEAQ